jgi:ATP-binding cassette subfamily F protein uup
LLQDYRGTLFLVSHDRAFLDNVVTQTIASEGEGVWKEYAGGYGDWQRQKSSGSSEAQPAQRSQKSDGRTKRTTAGTAQSKSRLNFKEERELSVLQDKIDAIEKEQKDITGALANPAIYRDQPEQVKQLNLRFPALEAELAVAMQRWEELEAKR